MQADVLAQLQARRPQVRARWEGRLRRAPATSPLANPATLAFLMDRTLDSLFAALGDLPPKRTLPPAKLAALCKCGLNPLLTYFLLLEEVLLEELGKIPGAGDGDRVRLRSRLGRLAGGEIAAFCAVCRRRQAERPVRCPLPV